MFFCAFMGNVTYVLGIVLRTRGHDNWMAVMPWLPGSAGTLFLDLVILVQYFTYVAASKSVHNSAHSSRGVVWMLPTQVQRAPREAEGQAEAQGCWRPGELDEDADPAKKCAPRPSQYCCMDAVPGNRRFVRDEPVCKSVHASGFRRPVGWRGRTTRAATV